MVRRSTWIVIAVFAALLGLTWYLQSRPQSKGSQLTPTPGQNLIFNNMDASKVTGLRIVGPDGRAFFATRTVEGNWTLIEPANPQPMDSALVESNLKQLLGLTSLTQFEAPPALEAVGLVSPNHLLEIQWSDGTQRRIEVGDQTPTGSGYYVRLDNTELLVVSKYTLDSVLEMVTNLPLLPTPTIEPTQLPEGSDLTETPVNSESITPTPTP